MLHRLPRAALVLAATAALAIPAVATATAPGPTERAPSPRWAEITRIPGGFRYLASLHDSNLTIRKDAGRVVFHDRAMRRFREALPNGCRRVTVEVGIAASCRIPATATAGDPLLLEILPQAGNDRVDGSTLGVQLELSVEPGPGDDTVRGGAAADLINGALGADHVTGGAGADEIRPGPGHDVADGGVGADRIVGGDGSDELSGNEGDDVLEGGPGNDLLLGGPGSDSLLCGDGTDTSDDNAADDDTSRHCELQAP